MANKRDEFIKERGKINVAVSDADMATATGGAGEAQPAPKFKVGDHFKEDGFIIEGYVTGIHGYYGAVGWVYDCRLRDDEGWFESPEYEFNMEPY